MALGRLGYKERELMETDVNAILVGLKGHQAMLTEIFGPGSPPPGSKPPSQAAPPPNSPQAPALTPQAFDTLFPGKTQRR